MPNVKIGYSGVKNKPYIVLEDIYLELSDGNKMYIPKGYTFDNGSIPRIFKFLHDTFDIKFFGYKQTSFLVHDFLYNYRGYFTSERLEYRPVTRAFADTEMVRWMHIHEDSLAKIRTYFLAVRFFGWFSWGKI
jgi:hypothetical protein